MKKSLTIAGVITTPAEVIAEVPTADALAARVIAGKTQDEILALHSVGFFSNVGIDDGALWRAFMARIAARQNRKASKAEAA